MTKELCLPTVQDAPTSVRARPSSALVLCGEGVSTEEQKLGRLLTFFGIPWRTVTAPELAQELSAPSVEARSCVLTSAERLAAVVRADGGTSAGLPGWLAKAESVYVYGFHANGPSESVLRLLTGDAEAKLLRFDLPQVRMTITNDWPDLCGPMSSLALTAESSEAVFLCRVPHPGEGFRSIIASDGAHLFFTTTHQRTRFYLNTCPGVADLAEPVTRYFDVKKAFGECVPLVMYLKHEFRGVCWESSETSACLIVDDPPLKRRYGFLNFHEALELMDRLDFTASIGFIPWNWNRTDRRTVKLFHERPDRFSLAVHGCDHTAGEFAAGSEKQLARRSNMAAARMEGLQQRINLDFDPVMIFPQGSFSPAASAALKFSGFAAAVNTEVCPSARDQNRTTIEDLWDVAIMKYGTFPIFTRRYLEHGIENFAFDALLGKPCLIAAHHDVFKDHASELVAFIQKSNSLPWRIRWRTLGDAVRHSFKWRRLGEDAIEARIFATDVRLQNSSAAPCQAQVVRAEDQIESVHTVRAGDTELDFGASGASLHFRVTLPPMASVRVRIRYFDRFDAETGDDALGYRFKTRARRHLSEFRDNWLSQNSSALASAQRVKKLLAKGRKI